MWVRRSNIQPETGSVLATLKNDRMAFSVNLTYVAMVIGKHNDLTGCYRKVYRR